MILNEHTANIEKTADKRVAFACSIATGATAGLFCGPAAPVCVTIGAFVGGGLAAFGIDLVW
jgi:hypothetical protein